jgi:secretion/DNA translocation related TadE-like protein
MGRAIDDRGAATVWAVATGLLTVLVGLASAAAGAAVVARHRAQLSADLGALAGAAHILEGESMACQRATEVVVANGAHLVGCRVDGLDLLVAAEVTPAGIAALAGRARATARAGPIDEPPLVAPAGGAG